MSWKPEVIADNSGKWCGNGLAFETAKEAQGYARDLMNRWTAVRDWRAVESTDPATHVWTGIAIVTIPTKESADAGH